MARKRNPVIVSTSDGTLVERHSRSGRTVTVESIPRGADDYKVVSTRDIPPMARMVPAAVVSNSRVPAVVVERDSVVVARQPAHRRRRRRNRVPGGGLDFQVGSPTNPLRETEVRQRVMMNLGQTRTGREAAAIILHPCDDSVRTVPKYPDGSASTSVALERRDEYELTPPADDEPWSCIVVTLPFLKRRQIALRWPVGRAPSVNALNDALLTVMLENDPTYPTGQQATLYPAWSAADAHGISTSILGSTTLTPALWQDRTLGANDNPRAYAEFLFRSVRRVAMGITTELDAPALANQGRVVSGQWTADVSSGNPGGASTSAGEAWIIETPPMTDAQIVQSDEFCRQSVARDGSYMPMRTYQPVIDFTSSTGTKHLYMERGEGGSTPGVNFDVFLQGWNVGVETWLGLSQNASLRIKVREVVEMVASAYSVYSPFSTPAYSRDERAMAVIREFARTQAHAYPAADNEWNLMWDILANGLSLAVHTLGLPFLAGAVRPALEFVERAF